MEQLQCLIWQIKWTKMKRNGRVVLNDMTNERRNGLKNGKFKCGI
jgi:hypothetical protein